MTDSQDRLSLKRSFILPRDFVLRRIHSLAGLWLVLFIIEHLVTNSQTALFFGDDGRGFITSVNWIHDLPYLPVIELVGLGLPFLIHGLWGIKYARDSKINSLKSDGSRPDLSRYMTNKAFTWQRITSWVLIVGIIAHVVQMRFLEYPSRSQLGSQAYYSVKVTNDSGLGNLSKRLDFRILTPGDFKTFENESGDEQAEWLKSLSEKPLKEDQVIAVAKNFGTASLLVVRDTFKMPLMIILYTLFVITASYHAFNGLWTAFITWGFNITQRTQRKFRKVTNVLMFLLMFLGLASVWLTYINLSS